MIAEEEPFTLLAFEPWNIQPVASVYTDYAIMST